MKKGIITEIDWEFIGAQLAVEDDEIQAKFFKSFIKEINSFETHFQGQQQLSSINFKLNKKEKEDLSMLTYIEEKDK